MWRGLTSHPLCQHSCCASSEHCRFSRAPVFSSLRDCEEYVEACASEPSNLQGHHHGVSLLLDWQSVEERVLKERARVLEDLGPARASCCKEFLINKRDAPLVTHAEASKSGLEMTPILSQYTDSAADPPALGDIAMPNLEDYRRCFPGKFFGKVLKVEKGLPNVPHWNERWDCAVFRGGATGEGVCPQTNVRLRLARLGQEWEAKDLRSARGLLLDAKLTSWNQRQKLGTDGVARILDPAVLARRWRLRDVGKHNFLSWEQQVMYKYAVYLDGNVGAGRLGALLGLGFVVLAPSSSKPATLLRMHMKPMVHYVPLREDLGDLREALLWLREHDGLAFDISAKAMDLHRSFCSRSAIEREMRWTVSSLPNPDTASLMRTLDLVWTKARAAVYVLMDDAMNLMIFAPLANSNFENDGGEIQTESGSMQEFLQRVARLSGERVTLPPRKWWRNAGLICNVLPEDVWGEAMLAEARLLLESLPAQKSI